MSSCPECAALGDLHLRGCSNAGTPGMAIGRRKRRRTDHELDVLGRNVTMCKMMAGGRCRRCGGNADHAHHRQTVQRGLAAGLEFVVIDRLDNLIALCEACHHWVHIGDPAQAKIDKYLDD